MDKRVRVECYAGHRAEQEPRAITLRGRRLLVLGIAKRWYDVDGSWFRVRAQDGHQYLLHYDEQRDEWSVVEVGLADG